MQPAELRRLNDPLTALDADQEAPLPWAAKPHDRIGVADVLLFRPYRWLLRLTGTKQFISNVPAGLGVPILLLLGAGLIAGWRRPPPEERLLLVVWLLVAGLFVFGAPIGVRLFPWRSWLLLAPVPPSWPRMACVASRVRGRGGRWSWLPWPVSTPGWPSGLT